MSTARKEETELHILKRPMGLTKRGSQDSGRLTVSQVLVRQTDNFTVHDTSRFVTLIIPTAQVLQTKVRSEDADSSTSFLQTFHSKLVLQACAENQQLLQPFYRLDVVLSFKETSHKMHWSVENTLPCTGECGAHQHIKLKWCLIIRGIF